MNDKPTVKIELTPEQRTQIEQQTGREVTAMRLKLDELEARLAPGIGFN